VLRVSRGTFERFTERISRLYERGAGLERIGEYVKHWFKWVRTGIRKKDWIGMSMMKRKSHNTPWFGELGSL
jgi:hypothetical protein